MTDPDRPVDASTFRFAVVVSSFHDDVTTKLLEGARDCLTKHGAAEIDEHWVPGAFELPLAAEMLARTGRYDAIVCLGCVIRGDTPHFDYVCQGAANGLQQAMLNTRIPMAFGVLTTDTKAQAEARAGGSDGNKGWDAALVALEMAAFADEVRSW